MALRSKKSHICISTSLRTETATPNPLHRAGSHRQATLGPHSIQGITRLAVAGRSCQTLGVKRESSIHFQPNRAGQLCIALLRSNEGHDVLQTERPVGHRLGFPLHCSFCSDFLVPAHGRARGGLAVGNFALPSREGVGDGSGCSAAEAVSQFPGPPLEDPPTSPPHT